MPSRDGLGQLGSETRREVLVLEGFFDVANQVADHVAGQHDRPSLVTVELVGCFHDGTVAVAIRPVGSDADLIGTSFDPTAVATAPPV